MSDDYVRVPKDEYAALLKAKAKLDEFRNAWTNPGINPSYHRKQQNILRYDWPVLCQLLERLSKDT